MPQEHLCKHKNLSVVVQNYIKKKDYENYQSEIEIKFQQDKKEIAAICHFPSAKTN